MDGTTITIAAVTAAIIAFVIAIRAWSHKPKSRDKREHLASPDNSPATNQPKPPPRPAHTLAPHQLPAPPRDFTGRDSEIADLKAKLLAPNAWIVGVRGQGGVGKSALALHVAHDLAAIRFPDAQIYLNLLGTDPQPLSVQDAMLHVVRSFVRQQKPPRNQAELDALYRSVLEGRQCLLFMDNAAGPEQIEPLLPPQGSVLLVTSRHPVNLPGLALVKLEALPRLDACSFLLALDPRMAGSADMVAAACTDLPLALRLAGSILAAQPDLTPGEYAWKLTTQQRKLKDLGHADPALELSYETLSAPQQYRFAALSVFVGPFDRPAVETLWDISHSDMETTLAQLLNFSLLDWNQATKRYQVHDRVRLFAARKLADHQKATALARHATHYQRVLAQADELLRKGGQSIDTGLAKYDSNMLNIESGVAWAWANASTDQEAAGLCIAYPYEGVSVLSLRKHPREQARWMEAAVAASRSLKDRHAEGVALGNLGDACRNLGRIEDAIQLYQQSLVIAREIGDRRVLVHSSWNLGLVLEHTGQLAQAIRMMQVYVDFEREIGSPDAAKDAAHVEALRKRLR